MRGIDHENSAIRIGNVVFHATPSFHTQTAIMVLKFQECFETFNHNNNIFSEMPIDS